MKACDYFDELEAAQAYVQSRSTDAAQVLSLLEWTPGAVPGTLRAVLYGHSILWAYNADLHALPVEYEVLPKNADDVFCGKLVQVLAFVLATNW